MEYYDPINGQSKSTLRASFCNLPSVNILMGASTEEKSADLGLNMTRSYLH